MKETEIFAIKGILKRTPDVLGKKELTALQLSDRGGKLFCTLKGNRVLIGGKAKTYLEGNIIL